MHNAGSPNTNTGDSTDVHGSLLAWHLARLRERTSAQSAAAQSATPLARIDTDKRAIEQMVLDAQPTAISAGRGRTRPLLHWLWLLLAGVFILFAFSLSVISGVAALIAVLFAIAYATNPHRVQTAPIEDKQRLLDILKTQGMVSDNELGGGSFDQLLTECLLRLKLRESAIADYSPELLLALDSNLRIESTNMTSYSMLGMTRDQLVGGPFKTFLAKPSYDEFKRQLDESKNSVDGLDIEIQIIGISNKLVDLRLRGNWSNRQQIFFLAGTDISSQKHLERMRNDFVATISHDIRNPLQSALVSVDSLSKGVYGEQSELARKNLADVEESIESVIELVCELMDLERSREVSLTLTLDVFDLDVLIKEAVNQVQPLAAKLATTVEYTNGITRNIRADRRRLKRVLLNILMNALKYSPRNSKIIVTTDLMPGELVVSIKDEGPGIPDHLRQAIFDRYFQASAGEGTPNAVLSGSAGLGLAICKAFIEAHGGLIGVHPGEHTNQRGSTFWFSLPEGCLLDTENQN